MEPKTTERYQTLRELGRGGMGVVSLVDDQLRGEPVARKRVLRPDPQALLRFKREFREVERLRHPNLVKLYELGEDADGLFYTMEVVAGVSLRAWCRYGAGTELETGPGGSSLDEPSSAPMAREETLVAPTLEVGREPEGATSGKAGSAPSPVLAGVDARAGLLRRLQQALPQVGDALAFLHGHGIVHRDLKPQNVLVDEAGHVTVLDFGVLGRIDARPGSSGSEAGLVGTLGYMAPEQIRGEPPQPASDLYSLGAMLYEILAGRPVFEGRGYALLARHLESPAPPLRERAPWVPAGLADLVDGLLRKLPEERPGLAQLVAYGPAGELEPTPRSPGRRAPGGLLGRESEQATLESMLGTLDEGGFAAVILGGPTGAGKTALGRWIASQAEASGRVVLRGRGRPQERVAFNAVDGAVDDLAMVLGTLDLGATSGPEGVRAQEIAAATFPVLAPPGTEPSPLPADVTRRASFEALATLLGVVARRAGGAVLFVDDLQWADEDSVALLEHLVALAPPGLALLATLRDDVGASPAEAWLARSTVVHRVEVGALSPHAIAEIVRRAAQDLGEAVDEAAVDQAVSHCDGRPLLAELAGRGLARAEPGGDTEVRPERVVGALLRALDEETRDLLALLLAGDAETTLADLSRLAGRPLGALDESLRALAREGLIRRAGAPGPAERADLYHDLVRAAVREALTAAQVLAAHRRWIDFLQVAHASAPERLVRHLLAVGDVDQAATEARRATRRAEAMHAFGLAADLLAVALLRPGDEVRSLRRSHAVALEGAARYREAATAWRTLAALETGDDAVDALLREAHALLAADDVVKGHARLNEALAQAGEPPVGRGGLAGLWSGLAYTIGPRQRPTPLPPPSARSPRLAARADRDIRIAILVSHFDPLAGVRLLRRARAGFAAAGAWEEAALCDYLFAYLGYIRTRHAGPIPLVERYLARAVAVVAGRTPTRLDLRVYPDIVAGLEAQRRGDWREASRLFDHIVDRFAAAGWHGRYEYMRGVYHQSLAALLQQDIARLDRGMAQWQAASREVTSLALRSNFVLMEMSRLNFYGLFEASRDLVRRHADLHPTGQWNIQRLGFQIAGAIPEIYLTDNRATRRTVREALVRGTAYGMHDFILTGIYAQVAALTEVNALRSGDPEASPLWVRRWIALARDSLPTYPGGSLRSEAYLADALGQPAEALRLLTQAEEVSRRYGQPIDIAVAQYQRGLRLGGDEGAALVARARRAIRAIGSRDAILQEDVGTR